MRERFKFPEDGSKSEGGYSDTVQALKESSDDSNVREEALFENIGDNIVHS